LREEEFVVSHWNILDNPWEGKKELKTSLRKKGGTLGKKKDEYNERNNSTMGEEPIIKGGHSGVPAMDLRNESASQLGCGTKKISPRMEKGRSELGNLTYGRCLSGKEKAGLFSGGDGT